MPAMGPKFTVPVGNPNSSPAEPTSRPNRAKSTRKGIKPEPLLDDYKFWGDPIPVSFGRRKVKGTVVWASPVRRVKARRFVDVAISLGYNLAPAVSRKGTTLGAFWFDGKKVFSLLKSATDVTYKKDVFTTKTSSRPKGKATNINMRWRLYEGNDAQLPDYLVKLDKGPSAVAFKNMIYLVITNLDFDRYNLTNVPEIEALLIDRFDNNKLFYERASSTEHEGIDPTMTAWDSGVNVLHGVTVGGNEVQSFDYNRMRERPRLTLTGSYPTANDITPSLRRVIRNSLTADPETGLVALATGHAFIQGLGDISLMDPKRGVIFPGGQSVFPTQGSSSTVTIWSEFVHAGKVARDGLFLATMSAAFFGNTTTLRLYRVNLDKSLTFVWQKEFAGAINGAETYYRGALFSSGEERADGWGVLYFGHNANLYKIRVHESASAANASGLVNVEDGPETSPDPDAFISGGIWVETTNRILVRTHTGPNLEFRQYDCPVTEASVSYAPATVPVGSVPISHPRYISAAETSRNTLGLGAHAISNPSNQLFRILNVSQGDLTFQVATPGQAIHVADDLERLRFLALGEAQYWDSRKNGYICSSLGSGLVEPCPGPGFLWPNMSILADRSGVPVGQVIQWMLNYVGIPDTQIDITTIPTTEHYGVLGGVFEDGLDVWEELRNICDIYNFVLIESDGLIKVKYRERTSHVPVQATLTDDDISVGDSTLTSGLHYMDQRDIPRRVELSYYDPAAGYTVNSQSQERFPAPPVVIDASEATSVTLPFVLRKTAAKFIVGTFLFSLWEAAASISFSVGRKWLWLEVGDVVAVNLKQAANTNLQMILEIQDIGRNPDFTADWVCTEIEDQNGHDFGFPDPDVEYTEEDADSDQDAEPLVLDVTTPEQYSTPTPDLLAASVPSADGGWLGGNLYRTVNETNALQGYTSPTLQPLHLVLTKPLANQVHSSILTGATITVERFAGDITLLKSIGLGKMLAEGNLCLIGSDALGWEWLSYQLVSANTDDTWTLTTLIRGRRGTEHLVRAWPVGTPMYFFSPQTFLRVKPSVTAIGSALSFTSVGIGQEVAEGESLDLTLVGNARKPFAPTHPRITAGAWGSNLTVAFAPRTRGAYNWPDNESLGAFPYDETALSFEVDILNASNSIVRTYAVSTPQFAYTAAHQTADFVSNPLELKLRIYQLSPHGRGFSNLSVVQTS